MIVFFFYYSKFNWNLAKNAILMNGKQKPKKAFSWDNYHERQIALRVAYIGWNMKGFTLQDTSEETVEGHLFQALEKAKLIKDRKDCHYSLCGRTDAGVSGIGNVVSVRVRSICPEGIGSIPKESAASKEEELNYMQILNGILPNQIRITQIAYVPPEFNARFDCKTRSYRYFFHLGEKKLELMEEAAHSLIGEHDFRAFCKFSPENTKHCVRRIDSIEFGQAWDNMWYFQIVGSGFIWHQIRCIASILFFVGDGFEKPEIVNDLLNIEKYPGRPSYAIADPEPLVFWMAEYDDSIEWKCEEDIASRVNQNFSKQLAEVELKAAVLRSFISGPVADKKAKYTPISKLPQSKTVEQLLEEYNKNGGSNEIAEACDS